MGELLLAGWAMLAEACPKSECAGTPLMRQKGAEVALCVRCDQKFTVTDGEPVPHDGPSEESRDEPAAPILDRDLWQERRQKLIEGLSQRHEPMEEEDTMGEDEETSAFVEYRQVYPFRSIVSFVSEVHRSETMRVSEWEN